ncbi:GDP-6-deoxy-D-mannose reductase [Phaeobacter sp. CECT 5382]|uniref:NAD-dependent epimerase/dehydratase family protein n=1 Tax=Phaeobacter sp. CECT 5382 TaxID=1712645 RepID=UPI0006DA11E2|nr:NAD(P)-dependent oxidoreductase [Phaeobacter sp. CECT 5382]CUH88198.1 GDP-6-deoxy-D-mannose reductase [Phaeobacter sp. CECT 5382]
MLSDLSRSSVLVTGADGFIGSHLIAALLAQGATVHAVLRPGSTAPRLSTLGLDPVMHFADVTEGGAVSALVAKLRPECVFNLAVCRANDAPDVLEQTNITAVLSLLEACTYSSFRRFVTIGSSLEKLALGLKHPKSATPYAHSRARAAKLIEQQANTLGVPLTHLRTYYVYGPLQQTGKLIPQALRIAGTATSLPLAPDNLSKDFVHVRDIVRACIAAVLTDSPDYTVADIATGQQWSARDVVCLLEQLTGKPILTHPDTAMIRAWDKECWDTDLKRARELLGWESRICLREGLRDLVASEGAPHVP